MGGITRARFVRDAALTVGLLSVGLGATPRKADANEVVVHPRVIANSAAFDAINTGLATDTRLQDEYDRLKHLAETKILPSPLVEYQITGVGEGHRTARELVERLFTLSLLYKLDPVNNANFADRAVQEMLNAANYPDWQPQSALDLGEITTAMSVGYDWCFDKMTGTDRARVRNAILKLGIGDYMSTPNVNYRGNWNQVIQSGIGVGCMAIKGETGDERIVAKARDRVEANLPTGLAMFRPQGATEEGVGYWTYGWQYMFYFFQTTLTAEGAYSPLVDSQGLKDSGYFPMYCTGPTGELWQFADNGRPKLEQRITHWVKWQGEKYNDDVLRWFGNGGHTTYPTSDDGDYAALLTHRTSAGVSPVELDKNFGGTGIVSFRSSWQDPNALFVGFKWGGRAAGGHTHLDRGSFVVTALGHRWSKDLGPDNYSLPGYFDFDAKRWKYYRCRAEGHNTLVINPSGREDQKRLAAPVRDRQSLNSRSPFFISDLTAVYGIRKVKRGIKLPERKIVVIQDEIRSDRAAEAWWFMHTTADVTLSADSKSATLNDGTGKRLWLRIQSPPGAVFTVRDAVPLPRSPNPANQNRNAGVKKLSIRLNRVRRTTITVLAVPLNAGESIPASLPPVTPLSRW